MSEEKSGEPGSAVNQAEAFESPLAQKYVPNRPGQSFIGESAAPESEKEKAAWTELVNSGRQSLDSVNRERQSYGLEPLMPPAPKSRWEAVFDAQIPPANDPNDFDLISLGDRNGPDGETVKALDAELRKTLFAGKFSKEMGKSFFEVANQATDVTDRMTESELKNHIESEKSRLIALYGGEAKFQEKLNVVNEWLSAIERRSPGSGKFLVESGALHSALPFTMAATHAEALKARYGEF